MGLGFTGLHDTTLSWFNLSSLLRLSSWWGPLSPAPQNVGIPGNPVHSPVFFSLYSACGQITHPYGFNYRTMLITLELQPEPRPVSPTACGHPPNIPQSLQNPTQPPLLGRTSTELCSPSPMGPVLTPPLPPHPHPVSTRVLLILPTNHAWLWSRSPSPSAGITADTVLLILSHSPSSLEQE